MFKEFEILNIIDDSIGLSTLRYNHSYHFSGIHSGNLFVSHWDSGAISPHILPEDDKIKVFSELVKKDLIDDENGLYLYLDDNFLDIEMGILDYDASRKFKWDFIDNIITIGYDEYKNYKRTKLIDKILC